MKPAIVATHTPGPWTFDQARDNDRIMQATAFGLDTDTAWKRYELRTDGAAEFRRQLESGASTSKSLPTYIGVIYKPENASLIAAAPELLDALKGVVAFCPVFVQDDLLALIAKAEGR